jgi:hypothetical protein
MSHRNTSVRWVAFGVLALFCSVSLAEEIDFQKVVRPLLEQHCFRCHGAEKQQADLRFDTLSPDVLSDDRAAETWHDVLNTLNRGEMPPSEEPPLNDQDRKTIVDWLTTQMRSVAEQTRQYGSGTVMRRLNRVEYANTMRDLIGIDDDYGRNLSPDSVSEDGFRNNGAALRFSGLQLEYYLATARDALQKAIVSTEVPEVIRKKFEGNKVLAESEQVEWQQRQKQYRHLNNSTDVLDQTSEFIAHLERYPYEGDFVIRVNARAVPNGSEHYPILAIRLGFPIDDSNETRELGQFDVMSETSQKFELRGRIEHFPRPHLAESPFPGMLIWGRNVYQDKAGPKTTRATDNSLPEDNFPHIVIESLEFEGPVFSQWPPDHHREILFDSPLRETDEAGYAKQVLAKFMARAFRRPVGEQQIQRYHDYYLNIRPDADSFEAAVIDALAMVLVSPDFLYLVEAVSTEGPRDLNDHELASRLSYFLTSSMPDAILRRAADDGRLKQPGELVRHARRLLADTRSWQFVEQFTDQWLDLEGVDRVAINPEFYPDFDDSLKQDMRLESQFFFAELLHNDLSALQLLDSDFVMLNERLARHYGIQGPKGSKFERVALPQGSQRGGLLAQGAVLLVNSSGNDSHPVKRAVWIRERLLDDPPAPPPPDVPALDENNPDFGKLSVRQQLEIHRKSPACNDCHLGIDPWGIAMEHYGADGLWRDRILRKEKVGKQFEDRYLEVDASSILPRGRGVSGLEDLKKYLVEHEHERFARAVTSKLLVYALGRSLTIADSPAVDTLTEEFIATDYRLASLIDAIVASELFVTK